MTGSNGSGKDVLLTQKQLASLFQLSESAISSLLDGGWLPYVQLRPGGHRRVWKSVAVRAMEQKTCVPGLRDERSEGSEGAAEAGE